MSWPPVYLLFVTYKRTQTSLASIKSLKRHLFYPNLHWHVCDDGSGEADDGSGRQHLPTLLDAIGGDVTWHEMDRQGPYDWDVGGNVNRGMQIARENGAEIALMNLDDFALVDDLDLRPMVDLLDSYPDTGLVRLSYWIRGYGGMCCEYHLPRLGKFYLWMRLIRAWCQNSFMFSMQPYVAHMRFFDTYGGYVEHQHPGVTEVAMTGTFTHTDRGPDIFYPLGRKHVHVPYRHTAPRQSDYAAVAGEEGYGGDLNAE